MEGGIRTHGASPAGGGGRRGTPRRCASLQRRGHQGRASSLARAVCPDRAAHHAAGGSSAALGGRAIKTKLTFQGCLYRGILFLTPTRLPVPRNSVCAMIDHSASACERAEPFMPVAPRTSVSPSHLSKQSLFESNHAYGHSLECMYLQRCCQCRANSTTPGSPALRRCPGVAVWWHV